MSERLIVLSPTEITISSKAEILQEKKSKEIQRASWCIFDMASLFHVIEKEKYPLFM